MVLVCALGMGTLGLKVKSPCLEIGLPTFESRFPLLTDCVPLAQLLLDDILVRVLPGKQN